MKRIGLFLLLALLFAVSSHADGSTISYSSLKPVPALPQANRIANDKINIIFDCKGGMSEKEFRACVEQLPFLLSLTEQYIVFGNRAKAGLFQLEPFKSSKDLFNLWYVDRDGPAAKSPDDPSRRCGESDFGYDPAIPNIILVHLCKDYVGPSTSTLFPILPQKDDPVQNLSRLVSPGPAGKASNVKSVIQISARGGVAPVTAYNFDHEMGHAVGGLSDEDRRQGGLFPNCAPSKDVADRWWKKTRLVPQDLAYVKGCKEEKLLIAYENTIMKGGDFDLSRVDVEDYFSPVHKYWICRNMYVMAGRAAGVCWGLKTRYGFDRLLYDP